MLALGSLAFAAPWLLLALAGLPVIWWLLRVTPPAPRRIAFPAIRLLLGLTPREETPARTPLWLILLRMTLAALVILALAHPLLNPQSRLAGSGPIIVILDDGWAAAHDWPVRQAALDPSPGRGRARGPPDRAPDDRPAGRRGGAARSGADPRRRRPRRGPGDAAEALARRPQGGVAAARSGRAAGCGLGGLDQRRDRRWRRWHGTRRLSRQARPAALFRRRARQGAIAARRGRCRWQGCRRRPALVAGFDAAAFRDPRQRRERPASGPAGGQPRCRRDLGAGPAADAERTQKPHDPRRGRGRAIRGCGVADRRTLAAAAGRDRGPGERRRPAALERKFLSRARAEPILRNPPRPGRRPPKARTRGADLLRHRPRLAGRGGNRRQMDRERRSAAALCRSAPCRAGRQIAAGSAAPRRPHDRRGDVLGAAGETGAASPPTARSPRSRSRPT